MGKISKRSVKFQMLLQHFRPSVVALLLLREKENSHWIVDPVAFTNWVLLLFVDPPALSCGGRITSESK